MRKTSELREVTKVITKGTTPSSIGKQFTTKGINFVKSESICDSKYLNSSIFTKIDEETNIKLKRSRLKEDDLLFSIAGAYLGKLSIVRKKDLPANTNQAVGIVRIDKSKADVHYLYYFFSQSSVNEYINNLSAQSSQPNLNLDLLGRLSFTYINIVEQQKIANVLSSIDKKIELNNQINTELEAMAKTLYDYWFVQFDFPDANGKPYKSSGGKMVYNKVLKRDIPEGWEVCELGKHIEFQRGISYKSTDIKDAGIPFINLNSFFLTGQFKLDGTKYFSGKFKQESKLSVGDLVIAITDVTRNADITGKAFIIPDVFKEQPLISCDVAAVFSKTFTVSYLEQLFNSDSYHSYIKNYATGTLVLHLNLDGVNWFKTTIPPEALLTKYDDHYSSLLKQRDITLKENIQLENLRDWLLPMLMNGQVTVK